MTLDAAQVYLPELIATHARFRARKTALVCASQRRSWEEFNQNINKVANRLLSLGLGRGHRLAVLMGNSIEMVEIMLGIVKAGACVVPLSTMLTAEQIAGLLDDSEASGLFVSEATLSLAAVCADGGPAGGLQVRIIFGSKSAQFDSLGEWLRDAGIGEPNIRYSMEDDFNIIYSSGTTGLPKGIVQTHRARQHWAYSNAIELRFDDTSIALATTPLYSNGTWFMLLPALFVGATVIIMEKFTVDSFLSLVRSERVTHTFMVPTQYTGILESEALQTADLSSLRTLLSAGSPLRPDVKREIVAKVAKGLFELYGFTEGFATIIKPEDIERKPGSVGRPVIGFDVRIVNEDGAVLPTGGQGEVAGHGAGLMREYFKNPAATDLNIWYDEKGRTFFRSGDIGLIDDEGFLYIVDRKKDMILSGGFNVFPGDIEAIVAQHVDVLEVAIIGVPHPKWGEVPFAFIVPRASAAQDPTPILRWANERLSKPQRISAVEYMDVLPRNALGKVMKRLLRDKYGAVSR
jgi:long-chain acyl-CoA synthetase